MKTQIIKVEFGQKGYRAVREEQKKDDADFAKTFQKYLDTYLMEEFVKTVKEMGYRSIGRGRLVFEEAIDYQSSFEAERIVKRMNATKKLPKWAFFTIDSAGVPKVE